MCVLSTQEILDPSVHYPVLYHHLELSPYTKAGLIWHAGFKELLYQENGCVPITYGTFQDPQGLSYPHKKYWTHRSIIQYYTITLNRVLSQRQVSYAMRDSKSYMYCTRKMAASQSRTVHSKTHRVCPIHTRNIGPIGPLSSTIPSPWIESSPKGRSHLPCMVQRATGQGKWLRPNHIRYIPRPTGSVLSTQVILDPWVHYPVLYHHLASSPYTKAGLICHARFKELLYQENGCVPITYGTFQDPQGLSYPHMKYWTHPSIIQYYTITLNRVLTQRQVSYAMRDSKSYCTRKMAASQSRTVHSRTHRVCPIHTRNIGPIGPLSSTIPSPWIESLHKGRPHMTCAIQRATVPGMWLRPHHVRYIPGPIGSVLSTQEILDPSVHYPVPYHHFESSPFPKAGLICHARFKELLYQENGCVPNTYGTYQYPQGLSYPHKKYWTHPSIIQYYTITLNRVFTQRQVSYAMQDSKSYCTRKMAASQSRTVHSKTHRVCPIHTRNIGPIGPLSSTIPSPWIESLHKGRSHMTCGIQRATLPGKWLRPNYVRYIPRPTGSVLSTQEILDPSVHYPVLYHHLESSPFPKAGLICHARFKELHVLYQENGCVPITYGTFQDPQGLSYPHKKYWTHRSIIQYYTITLNRVLTQRQISFAMHGSKSYWSRKMAASQSHTLHSKTHRVCPIHTSNIGPMGPLSSTIPSPCIKSLHKGRSHMPCAIQRATVPGKWLRPNHVRYIPRPTGSVLSTHEILDPSVHYPVLYHHLESSTYPKAGLICHARFKELLYQENGCVPITYGTFQDPQGLSYPHKKYWTHRSIIQYYTITLNWVLTQRQASYDMRDSKSYCTRNVAASPSRTVHSRTHRVCPIHTRNIGSIGPLSSTIPSLWIESFPKGRTHMPCAVQRATIPGKWLRPKHVRYIPIPTGSLLPTQEILDPSVHHPVLYNHLESSIYPKAGLICHAGFKELLYQENGCVPITYGTFQDPQGLSYPHKKYWTHRSIIQYYTITLNWVLTQRQVSYDMRDSKSYFTRKMAASQLRTVHSKTHRVCPIHTRNIGPIGPLSSTIPSPWIESFPKGRSHMPCAIQRATCTVPGKWLRPNHVRYIPRPTGSVLSTQEILDPSVHYPVLYHHLESSPHPKADLICHAWFKELLVKENGCVPITYVTFQDPQGLSYPHK